MTCSVDGCWDPIDCKQLCGRHRQQMRRYGRIKEVERSPSCPEMLENIALYVRTDECIPAPFKSRNGGSYPAVWIDGKMRPATHVVMERAGIPRPKNHRILNTCETPNCVNPRHLRWATYAEILQASIQRGSPMFGRKSGNPRNTDRKVDSQEVQGKVA